MQIELRHSPSYAVARLHLAPGEQFLGEAGVMVMQSFGVTVSSQMQGGFMKALKRSALGGESFFISTFTGHSSAPTWVDVAARLPGDATVLDCRPDRGLVLTDRAGDGIRSLTETIRTASHAAEQIATAAHQQSLGMDQIAVAMSALDDGTGQFLEGAEQSQRAVEKLECLSAKLSGVTERYRV